MSSATLVTSNPSKYLHPSADLETQEVLPESKKFANLNRTFRKWIRIAAHKKKITKNDDSKTSFIFDELLKLLENYIQSWTHFKKYNPDYFKTYWTRLLFVCSDKTGKIQAVASAEMLSETGELYIHAIVTHPCNIKAKINENESGRATGAGSAIIYYLVNRFLLKPSCIQIRLHSLESSIHFYEKLGFDKEKQANPRFILMYLTADKAQQILLQPKAA